MTKLIRHTIKGSWTSVYEDMYISRFLYFHNYPFQIKPSLKEAMRENMIQKTDTLEAEFDPLVGEYVLLNGEKVRIEEVTYEHGYREAITESNYVFDEVPKELLNCIAAENKNQLDEVDKILNDYYTDPISERKSRKKFFGLF